jgi:hypothetical protein
MKSLSRLVFSAVPPHHGLTARIWYSPDAELETLSAGFENEVIIRNEFYREIQEHPIPTYLEAAKALSCAPAALDLFTWLSYRCFTAQRTE